MLNILDSTMDWQKCETNIAILAQFSHELLENFQEPYVSVLLSGFSTNILGHACLSHILDEFSSELGPF